MAVTQREVDEAMRALILEELDAAKYEERDEEFPRIKQMKQKAGSMAGSICLFGWIVYQLCVYIYSCTIVENGYGSMGFLMFCVVCMGVLIFLGMPRLLAVVMWLGIGKKRRAVAYLEQLAPRYPDTEIAELIGRVSQENISLRIGTDASSSALRMKSPIMRRICVVLLAICALGAAPARKWMTQQHWLSLADSAGIRRAEHAFVPYGDGVMLTMGGSDYANANELIIPAEADGKPVVAIGELAFSGYAMERVVVPDSVTTMGSGVFKNCIRLKQAELGAGLTELGAESFMGCKRLQSIVIPEGVTEIRGNTFEDCKALTSVTMHDGITSIHGYAFRSCSSLRSIDLPPEITEIRGNTFENCTSLQSIVIPEGVTRIAAHAFRSCTSLSSVDVPSTVASIGSSAFRDCAGLKRITIPKNCIVEERAFKDSSTMVFRR